MDYFKRLLELLKIEREEDKQSYQRLIERSSVSERRANGLAWYPIAIRGQEMSRGDYLTVEVERTTHQDVPHQLRFGMPAVLFSNHEPQKDRVEGVISHQSGNRLKITLRTDELPEWSRDGKLGIDLLFDDNSYDEMQSALKTADSLVSSDKEGHLIKVLTGQIAPSLEEDIYPVDIPKLNPSQQRAVRNILSARELAIVHGPPGTGKTTTLVQAIKALVKKDKRPVLVVAPSNTEANFKKGVPMLNETVSEVTFRQPNVYKQRVIATRSSMDKNMADPNMYLLASFYQPEVVKAVSPLSPRAFAYYKFEYLGAFRENGIEVNKIKVTPRNWGEGVYRGTIQIIEGEWSIYSLDLQTVNTGFRIDIKQVYSPVQGVWMPVNQQFHVQGGIYGFKGKGDFVISQSFTNVKINPAFKPDIVVIDDKKYAEEAKKVRLSGREIRTQRMEEVVSRQKEFSAKNLRKMMKEYEKQDLKEKKKKGEDIDLKMSRQDSTQIDSMANKRSMAFWDSLRTVPLTVAEVKSYTRLDSLVIINEGSEKQKDSLKTSKRDTTKAKKGSHFSFGDLLTGHHFRLGKESPFRLDYTGPLPGVQVNTVEGLVLNGAGLKLRHSGGSRGAAGDASGKSGMVRSGHDWSIGGLTRYSFGRNKLLVTGVGDYSWARNSISVSGGRGIAQFNGESPMHPLLNTFTTLFLEQNFIKEYQKDFFRIDFKNSRENDHFEIKASIEYADRAALPNLEKTSPYRWIDWKGREFTSNVPDNAENKTDAAVPPPMQPHQALTVGISASYKPWQKYRTRGGKTSYYDDDSPKFSVGYRKGIRKAFGSDVDYDFVRIGIEHGFETGIRSKLRYKLAVGSSLRSDSVQFPDYQHFAGNRFFFQLGDPVGTFRMLDYYKYSTSKRFFEAHVLSELRQFLLTQIPWFRILGVKENFFLHYLATPDSDNYAELGYGLDIGIRFPLRVEVANSFEGFKYKSTAFRIGTTMNIGWGKD